MKISILAAGTWGCALAKVLANNHEVTIWSHNKEEVAILNKNRIPKNLNGLVLPPSISFTSEIKEAIIDKEIIIIATPSLYVRETTLKIKDYLNNKQIIVCVAKGIESGSLLSMSEVIDEVLNGSNEVVALSGPTHAEEVALDLPTLIVCSSKNKEVAKTIQSLFIGTCIRPYTNSDIKGVELCGALKNIIALACGIASGLGYGDNTKAAIITRGMSEIRNLGKKMSCQEETFFGLAGVGDLIVTSTSMHSRNNRCGYLIGQGKDVASAIKEVGMVVEGLNTLPSAMALAKKYHCELPIISGVNEIVSGNVSPKEVVNKLFAREVKAELSAEKELLKLV